MDCDWYGFFRPVTTHALPTGRNPPPKSSHSGGYTFSNVCVSPELGSTVGSLEVRSSLPSKNTRGNTPSNVSRTTTYCGAPFVKHSDETERSEERS